MSNVIIHVSPLTAPWSGSDPFLFCAHHLDHYPASDGDMGVPAAALNGRPLGNDFSRQAGFNMYYGERVPGFPAHPHRGFETVTFVRRGYVDHSDSLGATARYGAGDVQWLTAGKGIQHAEMFPLLDQDADNTLELFQIWLNLPASDKFADPEFKIFWREDIPVWRQPDPHVANAVNEVTVIAGTFASETGAALTPPSPPAHSWGAREDAELAIWAIRLSPGQKLTLPAAQRDGLQRVLYVYGGESLTVAGQALEARSQIQLEPQAACEISNTGTSLLEIMLMQARPINEPVAARGPFVMNTEAELHQARLDYGRTQFGGWPWDQAGPLHRADVGRFATNPNRK
ncbi:pirin family protein [Pseudomonas sp. 5P_3.1_Bac2]|uniref:pirin family protein n=1 Tax=Pseudomonas sp. 5P_3.1_Bac2 TaxID=2971617 RepID=UPI0021C7FB1E|nr:pirin family protein [Pseudomonas sp. 5P_3.1_Bac2]MCU1717472.1 pirin family protein [Pseudomonas sp. 5P_3.1_Bac2]